MKKAKSHEKLATVKTNSEVNSAFKYNGHDKNQTSSCVN